MTLKLGSGAMAAMAGTSSKDRENPHTSDEEFEQDQSAVIKNLMARIKELEDKLSIMKDAEVKASTDDRGKLRPIDIKDIDQTSTTTRLQSSTIGLTNSRNGNWEK